MARTSDAATMVRRPWDVWTLPTLGDFIAAEFNRSLAESLEGLVFPDMDYVLASPRSVDVSDLGNDLITEGEAAQDLGITRQAVHRLVQRGTLPACRIGRRPVVLVRASHLRAMPVSPQRLREQKLREADGAELGDELPEA